MTTQIVKATSKGQITLPKKWRGQFNTTSFFIQVSDNALIIKPLDLNTHEEEEVIFDADRDNKGKGVTPDEMIRLLKKVRRNG